MCEVILDNEGDFYYVNCDKNNKEVERCPR